MQPGIIHGDYHVGNVIYAEDGGLLAIVDWEMATLGDPLVDLGRLLVSWPEAGAAKPFTMRVEKLDGFPSRREMVARYAERVQRDFSTLPRFEVLACYKLGRGLCADERLPSQVRDFVTQTPPFETRGC